MPNPEIPKKKTKFNKKFKKWSITGQIIKIQQVIKRQIIQLRKLYLKYTLEQNINWLDNNIYHESQIPPEFRRGVIVKHRGGAKDKVEMDESSDDESNDDESNDDLGNENEDLNDDEKNDGLESEFDEFRSNCFRQRFVLNTTITYRFNAEAEINGLFRFITEDSSRLLETWMDISLMEQNGLLFWNFPQILNSMDMFYIRQLAYYYLSRSLSQASSERNFKTSTAIITKTRNSIKSRTAEKIHNIKSHLVNQNRIKNQIANEEQELANMDGIETLKVQRTQKSAKIKDLKRKMEKMNDDIEIVEDLLKEADNNPKKKRKLNKK